LAVDILEAVLGRVRLGGTLLYHYEMTTPWSVAVPAMPDAVFHYLSRGTALVTLDGQEHRVKEGDFLLVTRGEAHVLASHRKTRLPLEAVDGPFPAHIGVVRLPDEVKETLQGDETPCSSRRDFT
jgi:hypothetical protein